MDATLSILLGSRWIPWDLSVESLIHICVRVPWFTELDVSPVLFAPQSPGAYRSDMWMSFPYFLVATLYCLCLVSKLLSLDTRRPLVSTHLLYCTSHCRARTIS